MNVAAQAAPNERPTQSMPSSASAQRAVPAGVATLLHGPIIPAMLRLGLPTLAVLVVQTLVGVAETYFVGFLGTDALAGVALVFPMLMLMQMMANGGIGGGVAAAMGRALGAGQRTDADALLFHALILAIALGIVFTVAAFAGGPLLYAMLGGKGPPLAAAQTYSNAVFLGAVPLWMTALLSAALRGAGNVRVPAWITFCGALVLISLSPALIFGWGPLPALGVGGAGAAVFIYYVAATIGLIVYLRSARSPLRLTPVRLQARFINAIMGVGGLSAIGTIQANLTVTLVTGAVGVYGAQALAGYGIASRLDYLLIPLLFGFGTASVTMVAANVGAGQVERARRIAWIGAGIGAGLAGIIGMLFAIFPNAWSGLFSSDPGVLEASALYLRVVAPFYVLVGAGFMFFFAGQGVGRVVWPILGGTFRLLLAGVFGWLAALYLSLPLFGLFVIVAVSSILFSLIGVLSVDAKLRKLRT